MPYGEIFSGTLRQMWRHKRLWLFGLIGYALTAIGYGLYLTMMLNWQSHWFELMSRTMQTQGYATPDALVGPMLRQLAWLGVGLGAFILAAFAGYVINLVMRGATINEAAIAWRGGRTDTGRGVRAGASRLLHIFVIDLVWWLPGIVIIGGSYLVGVVVMVAGIGGASGGRDEGVAAVLGIFGLLGCVGCLALLIALLYGIFAPLMLQSAVQGRHGAGAAIGEGWRLAKTRLGPMIVFWLLTVGVALALSIVAWLISIPLSLPWMMSWLGGYTEMMGQAMRGVEPTLPLRFGAVSTAWLALAGVGYAVTQWLYGSLMQTFTLTMYAEVYRRLADTPEASAAETPVPPEFEPAPAWGPLVPEAWPAPDDESRPSI